MVHDRLQGVQMDGRSDPKKGRHDPVSIAEEDVLSSLAAKAPKEHQIGELLQTQVVLMQLEWEGQAALWVWLWRLRLSAHVNFWNTIVPCVSFCCATMSIPYQLNYQLI